MAYKVNENSFCYLIGCPFARNCYLKYGWSCCERDKESDDVECFYLKDGEEINTEFMNEIRGGGNLTYQIYRENIQILAALIKSKKCEKE